MIPAQTDDERTNAEPTAAGDTSAARPADILSEDAGHILLEDSTRITIEEATK